MLSEADGRKLISLARKSIESYFSGKKMDFSEYGKFSDQQGVFVTLHKDGELRGCIGFPYPVYPLNKAIVEAARAAAFDDPRFSPLDKDELKHVELEISVLSVPEELVVKEPKEYLKKINIGEDGLIIKGSGTSGLLLPQVFTEYKCTPEQALEMTCEKAGLPCDAWKGKSSRILKFQAQIFREN